MKNIKIYPKEWLFLHPYEQSSSVDAYYTGIANRIYAILVQTELANSFDKEECKQISLRMAAYFEDVISETGIWRTFAQKYNELYGKQLPFYTPDDSYYDDEVNLEDVRFLIWHYTQQYHGEREGTFVNPDNPGQELAAKAIYKLFCDEWTTAPENEKMQLLFAAETRYQNKEEYDKLLFWFHYGMYLFTDGNAKLTEAVKAVFKKEPEANKNQTIMSLYESLAYMDRTPFMGYTCPEWLAMILPETHPDYSIFAQFVQLVRELHDKQKKELEMESTETYQKLKAVAGDQLFIYMKDRAEVKNFLKEKIGVEFEAVDRMPEECFAGAVALYATPNQGVQLLLRDVEYIKDEKNPYYDEEAASQQALGFFIVKHFSVEVLKEMMERGMLADAQTKSLISPERGKSIVQDNWQFLTSYFQKESV